MGKSEEIQRKKRVFKLKRLKVEKNGLGMVQLSTMNLRFLSEN